MPYEKATFFIILLSCYYCNAQNYQCLQSGVKHYFTNDNGYLRGIRIDSVKTSGDTTFYYPFHTPRGSWAYFIPHSGLDQNGGSWLGKKVEQLTNGTFLFDNLWGNDTVIINTQANLGDSWLFYRDTTGLYYTAKVTAEDTMTFLGILDSVKTITINYYHDSALNTSDSLNGFQIVLSKNNGFVQVFDLYTFPYHPAGAVYMQGLDFYLDASLWVNYYSGGYPPGAGNSIYKLVTFIDPTSNQLFETNIGAVFEDDHYDYTFSPDYYYLDTIIAKTILPHSITYTYSGLQGSSSGSYPVIESYYGGSFTTNDSTYLFDTAQMPEEGYPEFELQDGYGVGYAHYGTSCNYYMPYDSSFCIKSPAYASGWIFAEEGSPSCYKIGLGQTNYIYETDNPSYLQFELGYVDPCGSYYPLPPLSTPSLSATNTITIFPNPATSSLTIQSTNQPIANVCITNLLGQAVYSKQSTAGLQVAIDVSALPTGIYFVQVNLAYRQAGGAEVKKFVKE